MYMLWNDTDSSYHDCVAIADHDRLAHLRQHVTIQAGVKDNKGKVRPTGRFFLIDPTKNRHYLGGPQAGSV